MIVTLGDQRLWVEGDKAYSIEELKSRHSTLTQSKECIEQNLADVNRTIDAHVAKKAQLETDLVEVTRELKGITIIRDRILNAESVNIRVAQPAPATPVIQAEAVDTVPVIAEVAVNTNDVVEGAVAGAGAVAAGTVLSGKRNIRII